MSVELYTMNRRRYFLETLFKFLDQRTAWKGTPADLADELHVVDTRHIAPQARGVQGMLDEYSADVKAAGWQVSSGRTRDGRWIALKKTA